MSLAQGYAWVETAQWPQARQTLGGSKRCDGSKARTTYAAERNAIEGKFGEGKRKLGLGQIRAGGAETGLTVIALQS